MRARILLFLAVLFADAALVKQQPWSMAIAIAAYLIFVFPIVNRGQRSRNADRD